jgi:hypothetical protein
MSKRRETNLALVGIRISELGGRASKRGGQLVAVEGKNLRSADSQLDDGIALCDQFGLTFDGTFEEYDTSGTLPLAKRPEFEKAIQLVEAKQIKAIVFPYRDRMDRSIGTMTDVVQRIDAADGVLIAGGSIITHKDPDSWGRSVLESFANEMPARYAKHKVRQAHRLAIAEGIPCYAPVPGYVKPTGGRFEVDESLRDVIVTAFEMRDAGKSINVIRRYLTDHGVVSTRRGSEGKPLSYAAVESMLRSPTYVGLVVFGDLAYRGEGVPVDAVEVAPVPVHEAIIDRALWQRVRDRKATRGRQSKSDRLLARQNVLVCGTCGARMTATSSNGHPFYRCQHSASPNCTARATVAAERVEELAVARLKARRELMTVEGRASVDLGERLLADARAAKARLEIAIDSFGGDDLMAAKRKIAELREAWQAAEREAGRHDRVEGAAAEMRKVDDWDRLTLDGRRAIIRATVARIVIRPVSGLGLSGSRWDASRVDVQFVGEG